MEFVLMCWDIYKIYEVDPFFLWVEGQGLPPYKAAFQSVYSIQFRRNNWVAKICALDLSF